MVIVDAQDRVVGSAPRREMRARRLGHRSTYILVFNSRGELLVHQRTRDKDVFPGYYDVAAGGVVLAGETYEQAARREIEEELGIRNAGLERLFRFHYARARVWGTAFCCVHDGEIIFQEEEILGGEFLSLDEVARRREKLPFTPDGNDVLDRYLASKKRDGQRE